MTAAVLRPTACMHEKNQRHHIFPLWRLHPAGAQAFRSPYEFFVAGKHFFVLQAAGQMECVRAIQTSTTTLEGLKDSGWIQKTDVRQTEHLFKGVTDSVVFIRISVFQSPDSFQDYGIRNKYFFLPENLQGFPVLCLIVPGEKTDNDVCINRGHGTSPSRPFLWPFPCPDLFSISR